MMGRSARWRSAIAGIAVLLLAFPAVPAVAADPVPDITGMFLDGWYPTAYPPVRPVTVDSDTVTIETDPWRFVMNGTATGDLIAGLWTVEITTDSVAAPLAVGPAPLGRINGGGSSCSLVDAGGEILELERAPDGTFTRFAASITTLCRSNPMPLPVRAEVRYHSTLAFSGLSILPTPPISWPTPHPTLDFGTVAVGDQANDAITVANTGHEPLDVQVAAPVQPGFTIDASSCADPVPVAGSCTVDVRFEPTDVGDVTASLTIETPDIGTLQRTITVAGRGTGTGTIALTPIGAPPEDWLAPDGGYLFEIDVQPQAARGFVTLETTCGDDRFGAINAGIPRPLGYVIVLPPGPCSATATFDGQDGWGDAISGPVDFEVPHFSLTWAEASTSDGLSAGGWSRAGLPVTLAATVQGTNGDEPSGGTLTITDDLTDQVLATQPVTSDDTTLSVSLGVLPSGEHPYRAEFTGDGTVLASAVRYIVLVDGDRPVGTVVIDDPEGATADPNVTLDLTATDASTAVTSMRLSESPIVSGGVLVDATTMDAADSLPWELTGPDGTKPIYAQWRDAVGNWSVPVSASVVLDRVTPTAGTPTLRPATGRPSFTGTRAPMSLRWSGADGMSGIAGFDIELSTDGAAYVRLATATPATAMTRPLSPGHSYRLRVRAIDRAGNIGAWTAGSTQRLDGIQQSSTAVRYAGSWRSTSSTAYWGGSSRWASSAGATAAVSFSGRAFAWVTSVGPDRGAARIVIDGRTVATVDLRATTKRHRVVVWSQTWASAGRHTVTIRVVGTRNRPRVDVDGFLVVR